MRRGRGPRGQNLNDLNYKSLWLLTKSLPWDEKKVSRILFSFVIKGTNIHTKTAPLSRNMRLAEQYFSQRGQTVSLFLPCPAVWTKHQPSSEINCEHNNEIFSGPRFWQERNPSYHSVHRLYHLLDIYCVFLRNPFILYFNLKKLPQVLTINYRSHFS